MTTTETTSAISHRIGTTGALRIRQASGSIRITGTDGDTVRVSERGGHPLADSFRIDAAEGHLRLDGLDRSGWGIVLGRGRRSAPDLEVSVPRGADVTIETASADVLLAGLVGRTALKSASGDAQLRDLAGSLQLDVVSADVAVSAVGPLDLRARTISGDLAVRSPELRSAEISTTSGDLRFDARLVGRGPFAIDSVSGDATIVARGGLRIEGRSVTGDLRSDVEHQLDRGPGRRRLVVGDGATTLVFNTISGDLRVVAARDTLEAATSPLATGAMTGTTPAATPTASAAPASPVASEGSDGGREVARLDILRAIERGDLSVEAAMRRLEEIEEA